MLPKPVKLGPLKEPPPSPAEWKKQGGKGDPPVPYEKVVRDAESNDLEYLIYHGMTEFTLPSQIQRRIAELEQARATKRARYNKAALYYLKHKLDELILES
jgi:hypothetical protein